MRVIVGDSLRAEPSEKGLFSRSQLSNPVLSPSLDLRKQLADFEWSIKPMRDTTAIGQLICMALRYRSDQKGCPQPALKSL